MMFLHKKHIDGCSIVRTYRSESFKINVVVKPVGSTIFLMSYWYINVTF